MDISKIKLIFKAIIDFIFGNATIVDYLLDVTNRALASISPNKREKIVAVYNTTTRVLAILNAFKWLCPTKWQTAYVRTQITISGIITSLENFEITPEELSQMRTNLNLTIAAWRSPDDQSIDIALPDVIKTK